MEETSEPPQAIEPAEQNRVVIIVCADMHHSALAALMELLPADQLILAREEIVLPLREEDILRPKPEEMIVKIAAPDVVLEERGRNRRRDWESPYGNPGKHRPKPPPVRNIKQMMRRRGSR